MNCEKSGTKSCNHVPVSDQIEDLKTLFDIQGNKLVDLKMHDLLDTDTQVSAQYTTNGGETMRENVRNLLDHAESHGNYWSEDSSDQSWIKVDFT
mgnify:CR=1 FL=1